MEKTKKDLYSGLFFLIFGICMFVYSYSIPNVTGAGVGAGFLPKYTGVLFVVLSIILINSTVKKNKTKSDIEDDEDTKSNKTNGKPVLMSIAALLIYIVFLRRIGFIIMSSIYLFISMNILSPEDKKNQKLFLIIAIVVPIVVYNIFVNGFDLMLPAGLLG